jgi:carboxymethylenebutenolidase
MTLIIRRSWPLRYQVQGIAAIPGRRGPWVGAGAGLRAACPTSHARREMREATAMMVRHDEPSDIAVPGGEGTMRVHVVRPARPGVFPGVVLFSEIYQITAPVRRLGAMVAGMGHVVAMPEIYHEYEPPGTVLAYTEAGTARGNALKTTKTVASFDADARACLRFLEADTFCTGRLATLGICLGGHLALRAAFDPAVLAAMCFYATDLHSGSLGAGLQDDTLDRLTEIRAEANFVWGRQDPHVPYAGRCRIRDRLEEAGIRYAWHEVNAEHAFLRDEGPRFDPALLLQAMDLLSNFFRILNER